MLKFYPQYVINIYTLIPENIDQFVMKRVWNHNKIWITIKTLHTNALTLVAQWTEINSNFK